MTHQADAESLPLEVVRRFLDEIVASRTTDVTELVAADLVLHAPDEADVGGADALDGMLAAVHAEFDELVLVPGPIFEAGGVVVARWQASYSRSARWPLPSFVVDQSMVAVFRVVDGRIVEIWTLENTLPDVDLEEEPTATRVPYAADEASTGPEQGFLQPDEKPLFSRPARTFQFGTSSTEDVQGGYGYGASVGYGGGSGGLGSTGRELGATTGAGSDFGTDALAGATGAGPSGDPYAGPRPPGPGDVPDEPV
jgi:hypothetical protein